MRKLAAIILNYNTPNQTVNLACQIDQLGHYVVIVDNCSSDDSVNFIRNKIQELQNCKLICAETNGGYAKGNNVGIRFAIKEWNVDYVAIMNPDIEMLHKDTLEKLCQALEEDNNLAGVTALTIFNEDLNRDNSCAARLLTPVELIFSDLFFWGQFIKKNYSSLTGNKNLVAYVDKVQGCFFVMKTKEFEDIGLFDEHTFLYFEEDIIGQKVKKSGLKLGVLLSEIIRHNHGVKDREMFNKEKRLFYNKCMMESKKYYMLNVLKANPLIWKMSYILDSSTRKIKDVLWG